VKNARNTGVRTPGSGVIGLPGQPRGKTVLACWDTVVAGALVALRFQVGRWVRGTVAPVLQNRGPVLVVEYVDTCRWGNDWLCTSSSRVNT